MRDQVQTLLAQGYDPSEVLDRLTSQAEKVSTTAKNRKAALESAEARAAQLEERLAKLEAANKASVRDGAKAKLSPVLGDLKAKLTKLSGKAPATATPAPATTSTTAPVQRMTPAPSANGKTLVITYETPEQREVIQGGRKVSLVAMAKRTMNVPASVTPYTNDFSSYPPEVRKAITKRFFNEQRLQRQGR